MEITIKYRGRKGTKRKETEGKAKEIEDRRGPQFTLWATPLGRDRLVMRCPAAETKQRGADARITMRRCAMTTTLTMTYRIRYQTIFSLLHAIHPLGTAI